MTKSQQPVFRFAPSPNGYLHLGHALSALWTFEAARRTGGRFLLRIEDIDTGRTREAFVTAIYEDLAWLGITWEEPVLRQSARSTAYRAALDRLDGLGVTYRCGATRSELKNAASSGAPTDPDGVPLYSPVCPNSAVWPIGSGRIGGSSGGKQPINRLLCRFLDRPSAVRLDIAAACNRAFLSEGQAELEIATWDGDEAFSVRPARPERWGDAIIARKDIATSYHLAVVVDDAYQGVTHVTRGLDLEPATDLHRLLQHLLCLPAPVYHHHRLMTANGGRKLSKSAADTSLRRLRKDGVSALDVRRLVGI